MKFLRDDHIVKVDKEKLKVEQIDTTQEARQFANEIKNGSKTFFLQGTWGSGKTEYLKNVEYQLRGECKFIFLELWKPKDKKDISRKLFEAIYPITNCIFTIFYFLFVIFSVIGSAFLSYEGIFSLKNKDITGLVLPITGIAIILVTLLKFIENKFLNMSSIFMRLSLFYLRKGRKKPRVLVIDDFDRLDDKTQEELYIIFNAIHEINWKWIRGKICTLSVKYNNCMLLQKIKDTVINKCDERMERKARTIFVGDLGNIKNVENNYLGKIIDQKVMLPYSLQSKFVSQKILKEIKKIIKDQFDFCPVEELFISEDRTIRDANQFLSYVGNEFSSMNEKKSKIRRVLPDQELFIIYLYLFHQEKYQQLLSGWLPDKIEYSQKTNSQSANNKEENKQIKKTKVDLYMETIFQPRESNPPDFRENSSCYFLNEFATNHSVVELKNYLGKTRNYVKKRDKLFLTKDNSSDQDYEEFLYYIRNLHNDEYLESQTVLETAAIKAMKSEIRHEPNELIKFIFEKRMYIAQKKSFGFNGKILPPNPRDVIKEFDKVFDESQNFSNKITKKERMYYFRSCLNLYGIPNEGGIGIPPINEETVPDYFKETIKKVESRENFGKENYDAEVLIADLGYHYWLDGPMNPTKNPQFRSKVELIEKLKDDEYVAFWKPYLEGISNEEKQKFKYAELKALDFDFNNQKYYECVYNRLHFLESKNKKL